MTDRQWFPGPDGGTPVTADKLNGIEADITAVETGLAGITKAGLGLENVDNTSDLDKPVSVATQAALDAIGLPPTNAEALALFAYGNSYVSPPAIGRATVGGEWPQRVKNRLHMGSVVNHGHPGSVLGQIAYNINNNVDGATPSRKWVPGTKGVVALEESINDTVTFGMSAKAQTAYRMALRTIIELLRAGTRTDATNAAITYTGVWSTGTTYLVNSGKKTSAIGAKASFSVTGDAVTLYWMGDSGTTSYTTCDVKIAGGATLATIDTRSQMDPYNAPGTVGTGIGANLCCTRITGMGAGTRTIEVVLTGAGGGNSFYFDGFSIPGTKPPQVILLQEGEITNYNPNGSSAARDAYNTIMEQVAAEYPAFVTVAPFPVWDSTCLYMGDGTGNHPNDKGNTALANSVVAAITSLGFRDGMHIL